MIEQKTPKPWYKKWWAIILFIFFGLIIIGSLVGDNEPVDKSSVPIEQQEEIKKEVVQKTKEFPKEKPTEEKPSWHDETYKITTIDKQEGMEDYDIGSVNVWSSYDDRSSVLFKLKNNENVSLIGYDSEHDYCQIKKDKQSGWIACGWIQDLPSNMIDYWEK